DILGGSVDLFLFDPSGREQRITIGAAETVRNIPLTAGIWQYNAFGMFWSGDISVVGRVE
ncbi:MAG: hypothetical protein FWG65_01050, partial [Turicibacter sp.]|nr:hypothetical protein [Turicibacter sp.]